MPVIVTPIIGVGIPIALMTESKNHVNTAKEKGKKAARQASARQRQKERKKINKKLKA